jgi:hypothetical protein
MKLDLKFLISLCFPTKYDFRCVPRVMLQNLFFALQLTKSRTPFYTYSKMTFMTNLNEYRKWWSSHVQ